MAMPFKGVIDLDIQDSVPDWAPFEPPKAPDGPADRDVIRWSAHRAIGRRGHFM